MRRTKWFIREWMIGWHRGRRTMHRGAALRHEVAEAKWRYRAEW